MFLFDKNVTLILVKQRILVSISEEVYKGSDFSFKSHKMSSGREVGLALNITPFHERSRNIGLGKLPERLLKVYIWKKEDGKKEMEFYLFRKIGESELKTNINFSSTIAASLLRALNTLDANGMREREMINGKVSDYVIDFNPFVNGRKAFLKKTYDDGRFEIITLLASESSNLVNYSNEIKAELLYHHKIFNVTNN